MVENDHKERERMTEMKKELMNEGLIFVARAKSGRQRPF